MEKHEINGTLEGNMNNTVEIDNSAIIAQINAVEAELKEKEEKHREITEAMSKVNDNLSKSEVGISGVSGKETNVFKQGNATFKWLKDNMDTYWSDMSGSVREECVELLDELSDENTGPIAVAQSEASAVLSAAGIKLQELETEINRLREEIATLQS